ncbi:hypothetical protein [Aeromonas allosaccharophila]|uniref:hypothetical protein n=1 Tax=Aeromonas allosaccharophila TaxID=656 RepID=UPI002B460902|nr:hypothetical protein [Aeromonas allosaccharophila]
MKVEGHLLISRKRENADELIKTFNRGLAKLKTSGQLEKMLLESRSGLYEP